MKQDELDNEGGCGKTAYARRVEWHKNQAKRSKTGGAGKYFTREKREKSDSAEAKKRQKKLKSLFFEGQERRTRGKNGKTGRRPKRASPGQRKKTNGEENGPGRTEKTSLEAGVKHEFTHGNRKK